MVFKYENYEIDCEDDLVAEMMNRKLFEQCPDERKLYMKRKELKRWKPTKEDLPSLVASVCFWDNLKPDKPIEEWNKLNYEIYDRSVKKCCVLIDKINEIKGISAFVGYDNILRIMKDESLISNSPLIGMYITNNGPNNKNLPDVHNNLLEWYRQ